MNTKPSILLGVCAFAISGLIAIQVASAKPWPSHPAVESSDYAGERDPDRSRCDEPWYRQKYGHDCEEGLGEDSDYEDGDYDENYQGHDGPYGHYSAHAYKYRHQGDHDDWNGGACDRGQWDHSGDWHNGDRRGHHVVERDWDRFH